MVNSKGAILLSVIIILLTIGLIGATLASFYSSVNISAHIVASEAKALYLAEAGIAYAVNILRNQAQQAGEIMQTLGPITLGEGNFIVKTDLTQSLITSTGTVNGIKQTVQLQFSAL